MSETKLAAAQGSAFAEITGRRWKIKAGDEMTRDRGRDPQWMPVSEWMIGALASDELHFNGWRIRRPNEQGQPPKVG